LPRLHPAVRAVAYKHAIDPWGQLSRALMCRVQKSLAVEWPQVQGDPST